MNSYRQIIQAVVISTMTIIAETRNECNACFDGACYSKALVFDRQKLSGQIAIDKKKNIVYFHYEDSQSIDYTAGFDLDDDLIFLVTLVISGVVTEPPAPYAPSGWRPSGPAFELPTRGQPTKNQEYLPPVEPRNPGIPNPEYGTPDDVSVQGLPTQEQQPIFLTSPINGQQYQGLDYHSDIKNLDENLRQVQYQQQQEIYRQFQRLRQLEAAQPNHKANNLPSPQNPRQFASRPVTPKSTTLKQEPTTTEAAPKQVTEPNLNEREILEDEGASAKLRSTTSVEITKQNIQQYPGELFLSSLPQLQLQPQFVPLQQIRANYAEAVAVAPKQVGFDAPAHFAALPSVLAQQQAGNQPLLQNPQLLIGEQPAVKGYASPQPAAQYQPATSYQPQPQYQQPIAFQPQPVEQSYLPPTRDAFEVQQPVPQYQPVNMYQTQIQAQPVLLQPQQLNQQPSQVGQARPKDGYDRDNDQKNEADSEDIEDYQNQQHLQQGYQPQQQIYQQPQQVYQSPQQIYQQPQQVYQQPQQLYQQPQQVYQQPQQLYQQPILVPPQSLNQYQAPQQLYPAQLNNQYQFDQGQYQTLLPQGALQQNYQAQDALQSGLDVNNEANDIDQTEDKNSEEDDASRTTAIANAFGARTQPRVFTQYGAPYPAPREQPTSSSYPTTTESLAEEVTENPDIAEAVAVSSGIRKRNGKLRNRRLRPVIGVDRSGRLVLAAE